MNPDISFILSFEKGQQANVIRSLGDFCINTGQNQFDPALVLPECMLDFLVENEKSVEWYYLENAPETETPASKITIGRIQLWIKEDPEEVCFEFWPLTSSTVKACMDSNHLRSSFVRLLEKHNGKHLKLDYSDGFRQIIHTSVK